MTILISSTLLFSYSCLANSVANSDNPNPVLSEAYSNKYKRVFRSGAFSQGVKRYRERARGLAGQTKSTLTLAPQSPLSISIQPASPEDPKQPLSAISIDDALSNSQKRVEGQLEALPHRVLDHAKTFHENVRYLIEPEATDINRESVPDSLQGLLKDVAGVERLGERIKQEILGDTDARHVRISPLPQRVLLIVMGIKTLLAISIESKCFCFRFRLGLHWFTDDLDALRQIIGLAEEAIESLKERDRLAKLVIPEERIEDTHDHSKDT
jgi:hypothetical protein